MSTGGHACRARVLAGALLISVLAHAQGAAQKVALEQGLVLVSATHAADGDRENIVTVEEASTAGVRYSWHLTEPKPSGGTRTLDFSRLVRAEDLVAAKGLNTVFSSVDSSAKPGTTSFSLSSQLYEVLLKSGSSAFDITTYDGSSGAVTLPGTLTLYAPDPIPFPVLLNGERVSLPTLQFRGVFTFQGRPISHDYWVLADRDHPLILRNTRGTITLQTVRIETPRNPKSVASAMEQALATECRVELPGVYFAFGTADLDAASNRTLAEAGSILQKHPDWTVLIEGHTDDIGSDTANQVLSEARAAAVRSSLVTQHGVVSARLQSQGYGETRPRESNGALEGRARNRRVELTRQCEKTH